MQRSSRSRRHAITAVGLVVVGLGASVVVASAALPTITDVTAPPAAHFGTACSECHVVAPARPKAPAVAEPRGSDVASSTVKAVEPREPNATRDRTEHETVAPIRERSGDKQAGDRSDDERDGQADDRDDRDSDDRAGRDEHETVGEHAHERDHDGDRDDRDDRDDRGNRGDREHGDDDSSD